MNFYGHFKLILILRLHFMIHVVDTLTLYSIITLLTPVFENIMENRAFAFLEQMLHFPYYFQKYTKLNFNFFCIFSMLSKKRK